MSEMIRFLRAFLFACYRVSYERDEVQIPEGEDEEGVADHSMHNQVT